MGSNFEHILICNFTDVNVNITENIEDSEGKLSALQKCDWLSVINTPLTIKFLKNNLTGSAEGSKLDILVVAEALLLAFVQENFTGPSLPEEYKNFLESTWPKDVDANKKLIVDTVELNINVKHSEFLLTSKLLLEQVDSVPEWLVNWWKIRLIFVHQSILEELTGSLYLEFHDLAKTSIEMIDQIKDKELETLFLLEICQVYILFHRVEKCRKILDNIYQRLGIVLAVEGVLGYRTKFQQKALPQLHLVAQNIGEFSPAIETNGKTQLPKLLRHGDEVRLERIRFVSEEEQQHSVCSIIQAMILVKINFMLRAEPKSRLCYETFEPYITSLLYQEHGPLGIRLSVLFLNTKQESDNKRTMERGFKQCDELLNIINGSKYTVRERLSYGFSSYVPRWDVQKQLGLLMASLGLLKTACDLFLEMQLWDHVIECYRRMDLRQKAAQIIRNELEKKETVNLYCLLGNVTKDPSHYEYAWKLSGETSAQTQKHWGYYYYEKNDYENAIPHLEKSLEINSLQEELWLLLGFLALTTKNWDLAAQTYLRYTHLEPNNFQAWNNLAKSFIKLGDKKRAHKILKEALKCNFENWKVWENFLIASVDTGNFEDVINAYNRLIELKTNEKYLDMEVLKFLVTAVMKNLPDAQGLPSNRLKKKTNELLAHQCIAHPNEWKLWELAAYLAESDLSKAQKLQKSYKIYTQNHPSWAKDEDSCIKIMHLCKHLCEFSLEAIENHDPSEKSSAMSQLSSARLSVQGCIKAIENNGEICDEISSSLKELKTLSERTTNEIESRRQHL